MHPTSHVKAQRAARSGRKNRWRVLLVIVSVVCLLAGSCTNPLSGPGEMQNGVASWYGEPFNGRPTASGEAFDMTKLTAAHLTLPFGSVVNVQDLDTKKVTQVRINDRGPFVPDRIIDLSQAAAQGIRMPGVANVRLQVVSIPPTRGADLFSVQIGAFADRASARNLRDQMEHDYGAA